MNTKMFMNVCALKRENRFSVIELFVVGVVIVILAYLLLPALSTMRSKVKYARWLSFSRELRNDPALIAYYDFSEYGSILENHALGLEVQNYEPTLLDGQISSPAWTKGRWQQKGALKLDGTSYAALGNAAVLNIGKTEEFTVAVWIRTTMKGEWFRTIVSKYGYTSIVESWGLGWVDSSILGFYIRDKYGTAVTAKAAAGWGIDDKWHLVVGVRGRGAVKLYGDGVLLNEVPDTVGEIANRRPVTMGRHLNQYAEMVIDEVAILNRALSDAEIHNWYTMGAP